MESHLSEYPRPEHSQAQFKKFQIGISWLYVASAVLLGAFHLTIGSSALLVFVFVSNSLIGAAFLAGRNLSFTGIFMLMLSIYSGFGALVIKALIGQPLQQNLYAPVDSAIVLFVGFNSIAACALLVKKLAGRRSSKIGIFVDNPAFQVNALIPLLFLGFSTRVLHAVLAPSIKDGEQLTSGFGGFGSLDFILLFACSILLKRYSVERTRILGLTIAVTATATIMLSVITNTKQDVLDFALLGLLSVFAFGIPVKVRTVLVFSFVLAFVVLFVSPAIHLMRTDIREMSITERLTGVYELMDEMNFNPGLLMEAEAAYLTGFSFAYSPTGSYIYPFSANVDRFLLILPIDQVARSILQAGEIGLNPFIDESIEAVLPSFLISKDPEIGQDIIAWRYAIRAPTSIARPVVGFTASSLAAGGFQAVMILPFIVLLPFLAFMQILFGKLEGRTWGVFGVVIGYNSVEKGIDQIIPFILRDGPLLIVFVLAFLYLFSKSTSQSFRSANGELISSDSSLQSRSM